MAAAAFTPAAKPTKRAAAAALILLQVYLPDEERIRRRTRDRFSRLEPALDLFLDVVDFIVDIVT